MSALEVVALVVGIPASIGTAAVGLPALWRFMCLPGKISGQLHQLEKLDEIHAAVDQARAAAHDAHEEWKGATNAIVNEVGRISARVDRLDQKHDEVVGRVRVLELGRVG